MRECFQKDAPHADDPQRPLLVNESPESFVQLLSNPAASFSYQTLADSLPLCLLIKDETLRRVFANKAYLQLRQLSLDEVLGRRDHDLFPKEVADRFEADDLQVMHSGIASHAIELVSEDGAPKRWIERFKCPLVDADGKVRGIQVLFWDVTEKKLLEQSRDRERQLLQALLDHMPDSIYFKDRESRFIRVSAGMASKFRLASSDAVVGLTDADIFTSEHAKTAREDELMIMGSGRPIVSMVERETWPDRPDSWCSSTKLPLRDEHAASSARWYFTRHYRPETVRRRTGHSARCRQSSQSREERILGQHESRNSHADECHHGHVGVVVAHQPHARATRLSKSGP